MPGVLPSWPNTTTTKKDFGQTSSFIRYTRLLSVLSSWKKRAHGQGFVHEETISPNRLECEGPEDNSGTIVYCLSKNGNSYNFSYSPDSCQPFGRPIQEG